MGLTAEALAELLARTLRGDAFVVAVLLERAGSEIRLLADRALTHAARDTLGVHVDAPPHDPRRLPMDAAVHLAAATMRRRTPAMWEALDALAACGNNAQLAAATLGCSGQAIRERRARAMALATAQLAPLFAAILTTAPADTAPARALTTSDTHPVLG